LVKNKDALTINERLILDNDGNNSGDPMGVKFELTTIEEPTNEAQPSEKQNPQPPSPLPPPEPPPIETNSHEVHDM
jgi:hypothetical protein